MEIMHTGARLGTLQREYGYRKNGQIKVSGQKDEGNKEESSDYRWFGVQEDWDPQGTSMWIWGADPGSVFNKERGNIRPYGQ